VTDRRILVLRTVLLWVLLEFLAAMQVRAPGGETLLWSWARTAVSPVLWTGETIGTLVGDLVTGVSDTAHLVVTNRKLQLELETSEAFSLIMADDMAARLEIGSLAAMVPSLAATAVPARTTFRDLTRGRMIALVATDRRIPADTPAVASRGVIGRVIRTEGRRCWIELITHPVSAVAVQTPDGRVEGLAVGSDTGELDIQFIPRQAQLLRGDELVTSGADGIYPPGLPVGRVTAVRESARPFLEVRAETSAAPGIARVVLLLDGWIVGPGSEDRSR
jgi:cell shape-determining protein MreC